MASKEPALLGVGLAIAAGWFGLSLVSRYSPRDHSGRFRQPTVHYLRAGLALDSAALARMDVSPAARRWILDKGHSDPELLRMLAAGLRVSGTMTNGANNEVTFDAKDLKRCGLEVVQSGCDAR